MLPRRYTQAVMAGESKKQDHFVFTVSKKELFMFEKKL
jgi:hypothetical protein